MEHTSSLLKYGGNISNKTYKFSLETICLLLAPFTPHITEEVWNKIGNKTLISLENWPKYNNKKIDPKFEAIEEISSKVIKDIQSIKQLIKTKPKKATVFISESWKYPLFKKIQKQIEKTRNQGDIIKAVMDKEHQKFIPKIVQSILKDPTKLPDTILDQKAELKSLKESKEDIERETSLKIEIITSEKSGEGKAKSANPHKPAILLN
jgi:leucyl-tRNA synthetase